MVAGFFFKLKKKIKIVGMWKKELMQDKCVAFSLYKGRLFRNEMTAEWSLGWGKGLRYCAQP